MTDDIAIKVEGVSKKYCRDLKHTMLYGIQDIARNAVGLTSGSEKLRNGEFWALSDVSFEIKKGETLGIIGANGSGKTTLLKLLNGIFMPDKGRIEISGKAGALIEVGAGFHPMLTGRENIYVNGAILGMSKKEIDKKFDEIIDFADIGDFIDSPVKHYSSGMYVRLGFAVAVHSEPDILLIDEVLAVGDMNFRMKCIEEIKEFQKHGKTIIYVSHEMSTVKKICRSCIWLKGSKIEKLGDSNEVVDLCSDYMRTLIPKSSNVEHYVSDILKVVDVWSEDIEGNRNENFQFGETVVIRVKYFISRQIQNLIFGIAISTADNICVSALHTGLDGIILEPNIGMNEVSIEYPSLNLLSGTYYFDLGFFEDKAVAPFSFLNRACKIVVKSPFLGDGLVIMEHKWQSN